MTIQRTISELSIHTHIYIHTQFSPMYAWFCTAVYTHIHNIYITGGYNNDLY